MPESNSLRASARQLFQLAQRIDRAEQHNDHERLSALHQDLAQRLLPVLMSDSARNVSDLMNEFFAVCEQNDCIDEPVSIVTAALEDLAAIGAGSQGSYALFAIPLLVPHDAVGDQLSPQTLRALEQGLRDTELLNPRAEVRLLERLVLVGDLLQFSEWTVARLSHLLAQGRAEDAVALVDETVSRVEHPSRLPLEPGVMVFKVLTGVVSTSQGAPFPVADAVDDLLAQDESTQGTRQAMSAARQALDRLNALLAELTGCPDVEVLNEVQGYWEDLSTCEQLMRLVQAQKDLDLIAESRGVDWDGLVMSSSIVPYLGMPPAVLVPVYAKNGLQFVDTLSFRALPGELPEDTIESALQFLHSHGLTVADGRMLPSAHDFASVNGAEGEEFDDSDDADFGSDRFVQGSGFGSKRRLH